MSMCWKRNNEEKTNHSRRHRYRCDQRSVLEVAASPTIGQAGCDDDYTARNSVQKALSGSVPETHDELAEESRESTVRDVGEDAIEEESVGVWVGESLTELV